MTACARAALLAVFLSACGLGARPNANAGAPPNLDRIAAGAQGHVGFAARVIGTKSRLALHANERFPMQSVYKAPIAMAVLDLVDRGTLALERSIAVAPADFVTPAQHSPLRDEHPQGVSLPTAELLRLAVAESDGTASDVLLDAAGGPAAVMRYLHAIGVTDLQVVTSEKEMGRNDSAQYRNWATPDAAVALLDALDDGTALSRESTARLLDLMTVTPTGPRRLKAGLPPGATLAHKTGTSGTHGGFTAATNDIGLVTLPGGRRVAVAAFVADSRADQAIREGVIARLAEAACGWASTQ